MRSLQWLAVMAVLALAACDGMVGATGQVTVLNGEVRVRAPMYYCVGTQTASSASDSAVVLIGRCIQGGQVAAALVTVTIGRAASAGVMLADTETLRAFMSSSAGRRALSRSGRAEDVEVLESGVVNGRLMLHLKDQLAGDYWRAVVGIKGRLVTVSASGAAGTPLTPDAGRRLVDQTVDALIAANPGS